MMLFSGINLSRLVLTELIGNLIYISPCELANLEYQYHDLRFSLHSSLQTPLQKLRGSYRMTCAVFFYLFFPFMVQLFGSPSREMNSFSLFRISCQS